MALNIATACMFYAISLTVSLPNVSSVHAYGRLASSQQVKSIISGIPAKLVIQSIGMDLAVGTGSYDSNTGSWTNDGTKAYYADVSVPSNDHNGTTLIYGHGQQPVFGELHNLQPNDEAVVYSENGYYFHYSYQSMRQVLPTDTSVFQENGKPNLVLQTCSGAWDSYRSLYTFELKSVEKA